MSNEQEESFVQITSHPGNATVHVEPRHNKSPATKIK